MHIACYGFIYKKKLPFPLFSTFNKHTEECAFGLNWRLDTLTNKSNILHAYTCKNSPFLGQFKGMGSWGWNPIFHDQCFRIGHMTESPFYLGLATAFKNGWFRPLVPSLVFNKQGFIFV